MNIKQVFFSLLIVFSFLHGEDISKVINKTSDIKKEIENINIERLKKETDNARILLKNISFGNIKKILNKKFNKIEIYKNKVLIFRNIEKKKILTLNKNNLKFNKKNNKGSKKNNNKNKQEGFITPLIYFNKKLYINYKLIDLTNNKVIYDKNIWLKKNEKIKNCIFIKIINNNAFGFKCNNKIKTYYISPEINKNKAKNKG